MSRNIDAIAIEEFSARAQQTYQGASKLRGTCRIERGVVGTKKHFPLVGKVRAVPKIPRAQVIPANIGYTRPEVVLSDWHVAELTDVFEQATTNINERQVLADSFAYAIGRQEDQFVVEALEDGGTGFASVAVPGGHFDPKATPTNIDRAPDVILGTAHAELLDNECPDDGQYYALLPAIWYPAFAASEKFASTRYGDTNVTRSGMFMKQHGIKLIFMGDRKTSASAIGNVAGQGWSSTAGVGYVWHKYALAMAYGIDPMLDVDWIPDRTSWLTCMAFRAGATVVDGTGVVKLTGGPTTFSGLFG